MFRSLKKLYEIWQKFWQPNHFNLFRYQSIRQFFLRRRKEFQRRLNRAKYSTLAQGMVFPLKDERSSAILSTTRKNSPSRPNFISGSSVFMVSIEVVVVAPWWLSTFTFNESTEIERRENYNYESGQELAATPFLLLFYIRKTRFGKKSRWIIFRGTNLSKESARGWEDNSRTLRAVFNRRRDVAKSFAEMNEKDRKKEEEKGCSYRKYELWK